MYFTSACTNPASGAWLDISLCGQVTFSDFSIERVMRIRVPYRIISSSIRRKLSATKLLSVFEWISPPTSFCPRLENIAVLRRHEGIRFLFRCVWIKEKRKERWFDSSPLIYHRYEGSSVTPGCVQLTQEIHEAKEKKKIRVDFVRFELHDHNNPAALSIMFTLLD